MMCWDFSTLTDVKLAAQGQRLLDTHYLIDMNKSKYVSCNKLLNYV